MLASAGSTPAASLKRGRRRSGVRIRSRIRGVYPRGLIEARARATARSRAVPASAGSTPAASLKPTGHNAVFLDRWCIRGVYPRGLIEASWRTPAGSGVRRRASAGSTPAASLKPPPRRRPRRGRGRIRGVYPRGLIEAAGPLAPTSPSTRCIRGVYPRGLIEAEVRSRRATTPTVASAGSTPAASLKPVRRGQLEVAVDAAASAGSTPAASLKLPVGPLQLIQLSQTHPRGLPPRPH